ncbi:DUF2799 domain-containing protein [Vibrio sp. Of7-15]|uniref:DUF2799 domain-containing protein n=1 Tax=Vibrio sp. Of7-15 TaxID=2724879 RepID=UPI001EF32C80|nr:DUF2799 domain-containing protein [Vibrio sp. Of7-15]MCG7498347.1 DUF2799 domain-containing protein [Vibrio sp. Of7-15]
MVSKVLISFISSIFLFGCASPVVEQFISEQNWYQVGYYDAEQGNFSRTEEAVNQLIENGDPDFSVYLQGYSDGKEAYCQPKNAWILGRIGQPYRGICRDLKNGWQFQQDWNAGRENYLRW